MTNRAGSSNCKGGAMKKLPSARLLASLTLATSLAGLVLAGPVPAQSQAARLSPQARPTEIQIPNGPLPIRVLVQSPADTVTALQVICLFQSSPSNTLHGSLSEINAKLNRSEEHTSELQSLRH